MPEHSKTLPTLLILLLSALPFALGTPSPERDPRALKPDPGAETADGPAYAEAPTFETHPEAQELQREFEEILTSTGNRRGRWAVLAVSMDRNDTLLAMNPHQLMVPASNMKVLTTAAALHILGPDFKYRTFVMADGPVEKGVLRGDLVLFGTGDPSLSDRFFSTDMAPLDSLAERVYAQGVSEVLGDLVVDGSFFRGPDLHPDWDPDDLNDAFAAPVSAISLAENLVTVRVEAGAWVGAQPSIHTVPAR
ncbi:MAG: D-alanyl-D-alanine carboxypeptidase/D-alanyl-D-alanine-endopeptidase, partial [Gemmatimonadetes bacterium]|nr:D-alanyl-D-alanine carboxypeptidase/D-alanyl-D-alanine-endopeptidase [Gemmatimonadota bacterium]